MSTPKIRARYLPTLTQVVVESDLVRPAGAVEAPASMLAVSGAESDLQRCVDAVMPVVQAQLRDMVHEVLDSHMHHLEADLRLRVESMVRNALKGCKSPPTL